jgi:hypothetical protein
MLYDSAQSESDVTERFGLEVEVLQLALAAYSLREVRRLVARLLHQQLKQRDRLHIFGYHTRCSSSLSQNLCTCIRGNHRPVRCAAATISPSSKKRKAFDDKVKTS